MKRNILTYLFMLINFIAIGQNSDTWTAFCIKDTLIGFKDKNGVVKIEPKFKSIFTAARKLDDIMAADGEINGKWMRYYLTKSGKIVGRDSLEIYDNTPVCESEGFICFRDWKTDKAGMFNRNGEIVIPAEYNYLSIVINGMAIGRKGAIKHYIDKNDEHPSWEGGKEVVINTNNKVLIDSFKYEGNLNFHSLIISTKPNSDSTRINFKSTDGTYFSFIDFEKEFKVWLKSSLLNNFTKENLLEATYSKVTYWRKGWKHEINKRFVNRNYELIKSRLLELNSAKCDYDVVSEGLNPFIFKTKDFQDYYNNCGESKDWIYPIQTVYINHWYKKDLIQNSFGFLRTDKGYKLLSITIRDGKLK